jgi:glycosyltransferase involved in cell wall biosynthesis
MVIDKILNSDIPSNNIKIKIIVFCASLTGGGAERVSVNLANEFHNRGYDVILVVGRLKGEYIDKISTDLKTINLDCKAYFYIFKFANVIRKERPDVVISRLSGPNIASSILCRLPWYKFKCIVGEASPLHISNNHVKKRFSSKIVASKISHYFANKIIANSKGTAETINPFVKNILKKVVIIPNPVLSNSTINQLSTETILKPLDVPDKYVISAGRLVREKGYDVLIAAFSESKIAKTHTLIILGKGPLENDLKRQAEKTNISVLFLGFKNDIYPYLYYADCFILSSWWEGFGNVLVEALACGVPVVSTDCIGGPKEILSYGKYGRLVQPGNIKEMASSIDAAVQSKIAGIHDKNACVERAFAFSIETITDQYISLF